MGNCQDEFQTAEEFNSENNKSQVLIDRSHKKIFATKYQKNVGFLVNQQQNDHLDNQVMHKSIALSRKSFVSKPIQRKRRVEIEAPKLLKLDLTFYHSLGLPQYTYPPRSQLLKSQQPDKSSFIHQAEDRTGVIYIGERNSKGLFEGNGILKANTVHYIGQFYQGTKHFHGRQIYTNQVYEGEFRFDFRCGKGVKYTEQYVDEGDFDKWIVEGRRSFRNGDYYVGTFREDKMSVEGDSRAEYYDSRNELLYKDGLVMRDGVLVKAKRVYSRNTGEFKEIGCFLNQKIVKIQNPNYRDILRNWDNAQQLQQQMLNQPDRDNLSQQQRIRNLIQQW